MADESGDGGVPIFARRTESLDAPAILNLVTNDTGQIFGRVNIVWLIEKSNIAITLVDEENSIIGHASFLDYPNREYVEQNEWVSWFANNCDFKRCTPMNTLFLHFFVSKPEFSHGSLTEIMRTLFNAVPLLQFVVLVVPKGTQLGKGITKVFEPIFQKEGEDKTHKALICHRYNHCPVLYIRSARVEDHDDLMPIFNKHNTELTSIYGDFFLSELIEAEDNNYKSVVADVDGTAVGFMSLSTDVDIEVLDTCFELQPFNSLKKSRRKEKISIEAQEEAEQKGKQRDTPKSRPATEVSIALTTEESLTPSALTAGSPTQRSGPDDGLLSPSPFSSPAERKTLSPVSKGSFHRPKKKNVKQIGKPSATADKREKVSSPVKQLDEVEQDSKRPVSEMTLPPMGKEGNQQDREVKRFEAEEDTEKEEVVEYEMELIDSVLCIQLFCIDEKYEMRSMDFLPKVFELFPEKDFCIMTIPHIVPEFPLLQSFKRATPKPDSTLSQDLYVFHRSGLLRSVRVRQCSEVDAEAIEVLVKDINGNNYLNGDVRKFLDSRRDSDGTQIKCYVAECMKEVIGVSVIRQEEDIEYIRAHYNIEDFIYFNHHEREEHGDLSHFVINPAFSHYTKYFLKEILRLSKRSCLYYPLYRSLTDAQAKNPHSLVTCLNELVPIRVRRQIVYPTEKLGVNAPSDRILNEQAGYSLYHMNRKITLEPKIAINVRIVVVGASDVGISCLDSLVNCPHLCFNNLTLVSTNALDDQTSDKVSFVLPNSLCFSKKEYDAMVLPTWVNVIKGTMVKIDRLNKQVILSDGKEVPYDELLLCTGQQFQYPVPTGADITTLVTTSEVKMQKQAKIQRDYLPQNIFAVNSDADVQSASDWIDENLKSSTGKALIYGGTLEAYSFIQSMLHNGFSGEQLVFVQPPRDKVSCFNNAKIEKMVQNVLKDKGVVIHQDCTLARWNNDDDKDDDNDDDNDDDVGYSQLRSASFTTSAKPVLVHCQAFFCFQEKKVDRSAFKAINDSCLVYDGKLVINTKFQTNDPFIKAAGSLTKFARRYHANDWGHTIYNAKEIGSKLADSLLNVFDPTLEESRNEDTSNDKLIPVYCKPKMQAAILPGGFNYLHVGKPSLPVPSEGLANHPTYGLVLETQTTDDDNYFRLHLNPYNSIETITCCTRQKIDIENLICLYGIHERCLNDMVQRYDEGLIKDFYSFFQESWCLAIFHDRFNDFCAELREILAEKEAGEILSLEEKVRKSIKEDFVLSKEQRDLIAAVYRTSRSRRQVEQRLLSFLNYNSYHLPMYAKPGIV